uniref:Ig-like domain-containing protein n=1 Tax=Stegastes partitus TaxID=144197 RepID=A0A3B5B864_9TELE
DSWRPEKQSEPVRAEGVITEAKSSLSIQPTETLAFQDSVSFSCTYDSEHETNLKYVCRGKQPSTCLQQALITSDHQQSGRFVLTDDKESRKFTVTISSLTQKDSGLYLCGVHRNTGLDVFSAVELEIKGYTPSCYSKLKHFTYNVQYITISSQWM